MPKQPLAATPQPVSKAGPFEHLIPRTLQYGLTPAKPNPTCMYNANMCAANNARDTTKQVKAAAATAATAATAAAEAAAEAATAAAAAAAATLELAGVAAPHPPTGQSVEVTHAGDEEHKESSQPGSGSGSSAPRPFPTFSSFNSVEQLWQIWDVGTRYGPALRE